MKKKKHHFVPRTYLQSFAGDDGYLYVYNKDAPDQPFRSLPENTAFHKYYYSVPDQLKGVDHNMLEDSFSEVENKWPGIVKRLEQKENLADSIEDLYVFIALQRARVPALRDSMELAEGEIVKSTLLMLEQQGLLPPKPKALEGLSLAEAVEVSIDPYRSIQNMPSIMSGVGQILDWIGLSVLHNKTDIPFITSDNPVIYLDPTVRREAVQPYNIDRERKDIVFLFPVSPTMMLFGTSEMREDFKKCGVLHGRDFDNPRLVQELNRDVCRFAYKAVFSKNDDIGSLVREHAGTSPVIKLDTLPMGGGNLTVGRHVFGERVEKPKWRKG
jgi:hypothetical protein